MTSLYFPIRYPTNMNCVWNIYASKTMSIVVEFQQGCHLEDNYDFMTIGEGDYSSNDNSVIAKLTGEILIRHLASNNSAMWIMFVTDDSWSNSGFSVQLQQQEPSNGMFDSSGC